MAERFLSQTLHDKTLDVSLRPTKFSEFVAQDKIRERLEVAIAAARQRKEAVDHVLLIGPPGLGKTTLAYIIAHALGVNVIATSGPALEKAGDLAGLLTSLQPRDVLFIDEIHRLQKNVEEYLYSAMEDFQLDIVIDQGPAARTVRLTLPRFTLVGATTRSGLLSAPLRSRFGLTERLDYYSPDDLARIVQRSAKILGVKIGTDAAAELARRARGTPRIANNLLKRARDFAQVKRNSREISEKTVNESLAMLGIDEHGLDEMDMRILQTLVQKFGGKPVGVGSLAVAVGEERDTIEEVYEPFLIQQGYLKRTPQGRVPTESAYNKVGAVIGKPEKELF
jgi:Holliday junction DNA helicase RuvB